MPGRIIHHGRGRYLPIPFHERYIPDLESSVKLYYRVHRMSRSVSPNFPFLEVLTGHLPWPSQLKWPSFLTPPLVGSACIASAVSDQCSNSGTLSHCTRGLGISTSRVHLPVRELRADRRPSESYYCSRTGLHQRPLGLVKVAPCMSEEAVL